MKRRALEKHLRSLDCRLHAHGARHDRWIGPAGTLSVVPRHREIDGALVRAICRQLRVGVPANPN